MIVMKLLNRIEAHFLLITFLFQFKDRDPWQECTLSCVTFLDVAMKTILGRTIHGYIQLHVLSDTAFHFRSLTILQKSHKKKHRIHNSILREDSVTNTRFDNAVHSSLPEEYPVLVTGTDASATEMKKRTKRHKKMRKARIGIMAKQAFTLPHHYPVQSQDGVFRPTQEFHRVPQTGITYMNNAPPFAQSIPGTSIPYIPSPGERLPHLSQQMSRSFADAQPPESQLPPIRQSLNMSVDSRTHWTAPGTVAPETFPPQRLRRSSVLDISTLGNPSDVEHTQLDA